MSEINGLRTVELDELEALIQLLQIENPRMKEATYTELKDALKSEYGIRAKYSQIYLVYEPTIEDDIRDAEIFYGNVLGFGYGSEIRE